MSWWKKLRASALTLPLLDVALSGATPFPVQVWKQSDDGLTNKLADAIQNAIRHSPRLKLSASKGPEALYLNVSPALWEEVGDHTRVTYFVDYGRSANDPKPITKAQGTCWDYQIDRCAADIVARAEAVASGNSH